MAVVTFAFIAGVLVGVGGIVGIVSILLTPSRHNPLM
jgi:hypothetical protein